MTLRVLHVTQAAATGVMRHLIALTRSTPDLEHHVVLPRPDVPLGLGAVRDEDGVAALLGAGARIHVVDMRRSPLHPANALAVARVGRLLGRVRPDVVHAHSSIGGVVARTAAAPLRLPVVYASHSLGAARRGGPRAVERLLRGLTTVLVAVSETERAEALSLGLGAQLGIEVIPNGIDSSHVPTGRDPRASLGLAPGTPLVAMVARLAPQKDPVMFAEACAHLARLMGQPHFLLVGSGPLQADVDAVVARHRLGPRWHQMTDVTDAASLMPHVDVLLHCSAAEGLPYALLEAMRAGTAVVATEVTGNRDLVRHGRTGLLVPLGDPATAASSVRLLLSEPVTRERIEAEARRLVADRFSLEQMGAAYRQLYQRLAAQPSEARR